MKYMLLILLLCNASISIAQHGAKWLTGAGNMIDFTVTPTISYLECDIFTSGAYIYGHSMISDTNGKMLFCATPYYIHHLGCGGFNLNMDNGFKDVTSKIQQDNYDFHQQSIALPKKDNQYYMFYKSMSNQAYDDEANHVADLNLDLFLNHVIDMNQNNGLGKVVLKDNSLMSGARLSANALSAVKHGNGRDWWLVVPHRERYLLYTFRVTGDSIIGPELQDFGLPDFQASNWGQSNFSPDGSLYSITQFGSPFVQVHTMDRCSGKMTKYKSIVAPKDTFFYYNPDWNKDTFNLIPAHSGVCFSSDNRFLYLVSTINVWQYDLQTDEVIPLNTDTFVNPATNILAYNAPDGRIYIGNANGTMPSIGYIEYPLKKGTDAHFCQHCLKTVLTTTVPPNMPNYELGALVGSPCDTIKPYVEPPPPQPTTLLNILIANAFSPNGDGKNDTWHILNIAQLQLAGITLQAVGVYNRWGNEVFKSSDINFSWDGASLSSDTYYYYIRYRTLVGTSQIQKGSVNLVR